MTIAFNQLRDAQLSYAAIFLCCSVGFLFLKRIYKEQSGPGRWSLAFLSNAIGFSLWSGIAPLRPLAYYLAGEVFHVLGFFLLVYGALAFVGALGKARRVIAFIVAWIALWIVSIFMLRYYLAAASIALKLLRSLIFLSGGLVLLLKKDEDQPVGKNLAGYSLLLWALFVAVSGFVEMNSSVFYGSLTGLHVLAAFGMVAMVVDRIRVQAERRERHVEHLEGILPICCYCKKIRDEKDEWRALEDYIETRSKAEFSHGVCPECFEKHRPDRK